jgi:hypothetical protein
MRAVLTLPLSLALPRRDAQGAARRRRGEGEEPSLPYALAYALALGGAATLAFADFSASESNMTQTEARPPRRPVR